MEGMAPSDPCHFSEVPKTCEQPHALVIDVPERSTYCLSLVTSILRWLKQKDTQKFERNQKHVTLQPTMSSRDWSENGCSNTPEINLTLRISDTMMQGILGSLIQGRCKALNLPAIVTQLEGHQSNSLRMHTRGMKKTMNFCACDIYDATTA